MVCCSLLTAGTSWLLVDKLNKNPVNNCTSQLNITIMDVYMTILSTIVVGSSLLNKVLGGSPQRGVGLAFKNCTDAVVLDVSWYYTWHPYSPACPNGTSNKMSFIPMIFDESQLNYTYSLKNGNYEALLGFNEPNAVNQANMTVDEAIAAWPYLMNTGLRLGSPAPDKAGAFTWLKEFMQQIDEKNYTVDFLCFHWYARNNTNADELYSFLQQIEQEYPGYKIWLTEFANATGSEQDNINFFQTAYSYIINDFSDLIERYAWFTNRWSEEGKSQKLDLISWDTNQPNDLGNLYKSKPAN